ncbi:DDE-type integrase/transposase/recombinase [Streptomyces sp. NPDC051014]|uniref:DDE-type integrase/transposase/recombinase n=1 Tax=Streptomyces sp. NPDC051014 TaxID=3155751 RepID=UPI0033EC2506
MHHEDRIAAREPDTTWCGDITCVPVGWTWLYLASAIDICSRRGVGWSFTDHMWASLVSDALGMVLSPVADASTA